MATKVLVVDDEADIRELVTGLLEDEGFSPRSAFDSDTALAAGVDWLASFHAGFMDVSHSPQMRQNIVTNLITSLHTKQSSGWA